MGKKKKKEGPSGPPGAPEWVVTFTDMISLLVTFFVLLMTFSSLEENELLKVDAWLAGRGGIKEMKGLSVTDPFEALQANTSVNRGSINPHSRPPEQITETIEEMGQKADAEHVEMDFSTVPDGLVIEFGPEESFAPGSARLPKSLERNLDEIGRVLEHYPHLVVVEGFTDAAFEPTSFYPSAEALSFARAEAAVEALLAGSQMQPELIQIEGLGAEKPRANDNSSDGRRLNRRVQLRILSLSKLREFHLETLREQQRKEAR